MRWKVISGTPEHPAIRQAVARVRYDNLMGNNAIRQLWMHLYVTTPDGQRHMSYRPKNGYSYGNRYTVDSQDSDYHVLLKQGDYLRSRFAHKAIYWMRDHIFNPPSHWTFHIDQMLWSGIDLIMCGWDDFCTRNEIFRYGQGSSNALYELTRVKPTFEDTQNTVNPDSLLHMLVLSICQNDQYEMRRKEKEPHFEFTVSVHADALHELENHDGWEKGTKRKEFVTRFMACRAIQGFAKGIHSKFTLKTVFATMDHEDLNKHFVAVTHYTMMNAKHDGEFGDNQTHDLSLIHI